MRFIVLLVFTVIFCPAVAGQNLVGFKDYEIKKYMSEKRKDMNLDKVVNSKFVYLKYSDSSDSQTVLFFLNPYSVCTNIRIICDERVRDERIKEFNSLYKPAGENTWLDSRNGKDYVIRITDDKWSSTITMAPAN